MKPGTIIQTAQGDSLVPVEYAADEFRTVSAERAPLRGARWVTVSNRWQRMDYETAEWALKGGRIVALACAAEERQAIEVALLYDLGFKIATTYRNGLLWVRKVDTDATAARETN